jgi:exopolysaccharide production protein ExoQ
MPDSSVSSYLPGRPRARAPLFDICAMIALSACTYALVVDPIILYLTTGGMRPPNIMTPRIDPRIFWPGMAIISVMLAAQKRQRFGKIVWPPHIICLLFYVAFAGISVLWAFSPDRSAIRYIQQLMVISSVVLSASLSARTVDLMRGLFLCFTIALILNLVFVLCGSVTIAQYGSANVDIGYQGYYLGKNYLGECAAPALLLALDEALHRGWRRLFGIISAIIAVLLIYLSDSKTALGLAIICPFLTQVTLTIRKLTRLSPAIILSCIPLCYIVVSHVSNFNMDRLAYMVYGDSTLTGRTVIWAFVQSEINQRPLLGWGYQSFWFVPGSPALTEAPGWVKIMPNAHNGYFDTTLELGHVGLTLLLAFIFASLHAIGRFADRDPARARLLLSLALFVICWNYFESLWMRGYEFLWVLFLFVVVEIARCCQPLPARRAVRRSRRPAPAEPGPLAAIQVHQLHVRPS